jgi:hypothetical protein
VCAACSDKEISRGEHALWGIDAQQNVGQFKDGAFVPRFHYDLVFGPEVGRCLGYQYAFQRSWGNLCTVHGSNSYQDDTTG